jgi:hypothetical protein
MQLEEGSKHSIHCLAFTIIKACHFLDLFKLARHVSRSWVRLHCDRRHISLLGQLATAPRHSQGECSRRWLRPVVTHTFWPYSSVREPTATPNFDPIRFPRWRVSRVAPCVRIYKLIFFSDVTKQIVAVKQALDENATRSTRLQALGARLQLLETEYETTANKIAAIAGIWQAVSVSAHLEHGYLVLPLTAPRGSSQNIHMARNEPKSRRTSNVGKAKIRPRSERKLTSTQQLMDEKVKMMRSFTAVLINQLDMYAKEIAKVLPAGSG